MSRICVCSDRMGAFGPVAAGTAVARAFAQARPGRDQVAVVPLAAGGADLAEALSALGRPTPVIAADNAKALGLALADTLAQEPERVIVDLTALTDIGPEAFADLAGPLGLDLDAGSPASPATDLVVLIEANEASDVLLGVSGLAARRGYAQGRAVAEVLAEDSALAALAARLQVADSPGLGAAGGLPLVLCALGARISTGVAECRAAARLDDTIAHADLLVVGVHAVHAGNFGGPVLLELAPLAAELGVPCLAVAPTVDISSRELRRHGVESAHPLGRIGDADPAGLTRACGPIARTWLG